MNKNISLKKEIIERLEKEAEAKHMTVSEYIRSLLFKEWEEKK